MVSKKLTVMFFIFTLMSSESIHALPANNSWLITETQAADNTYYSVSNSSALNINSFFVGFNPVTVSITDQYAVTNYSDYSSLDNSWDGAVVHSDEWDNTPLNTLYFSPFLPLSTAAYGFGTSTGHYWMNVNVTAAEYFGINLWC